MAEASWPFYGVESTETQFSKLMRVMADSGISSGLALAPVSGMGVGIAAGFALVRGLAYENTTTKTLTHGAAPAAGTTRLDAYILKLDQNANTIVAAIKAGTASSGGGALPAFTQNETDYEWPIGYATIPSGTAAITAGMITEYRPMVGSRVLVNTTARKPAAATVPDTLFFNTTTKRLEFSNGTTWTDLGDLANTTGTLAVNRGGTGQITAKAALQALGIYVQPAAPAHFKGRVWIPGTAPD